MDTCITAIVLAFGTYRGWTSLPQYGQGLLIAGVIIASVGVMSLSGPTSIGNEARLLVPRERMFRDVNDMTMQNNLDRLQAISNLLLLGTAGLLLLAIGLVLQAIG